MNERALFKKCPKCGKRFEVKHVGETVERKQELVPETKSYLTPSGMASAYPIPTPGASTFKVEEAIEEDTFTETYTCAHCGNVWTEMSEKTKDLGETKADED